MSAEVGYVIGYICLAAVVLWGLYMAATDDEREKKYQDKIRTQYLEHNESLNLNSNSTTSTSNHEATEKALNSASDENEKPPLQFKVVKYHRRHNIENKQPETAPTFSETLTAPDNDWICLDTETTGLREPQVIELAIISKDGNTLFNRRFKPNKNVEIDASNVHGIRTNDLINEDSFEKHFDQILNLIKDKTVIGYNIDFDLTAIRNSTNQENFEIKTFCVMNFANQIYRRNYNLSLIDLAFALQVDYVTHHHALTDAKVTAECFAKLVEVKKVYDKNLSPEVFNIDPGALTSWGAGTWMNFWQGKIASRFYSKNSNAFCSITHSEEDLHDLYDNFYSIIDNPDIPPTKQWLNFPNPYGNEKLTDYIEKQEEIERQKIYKERIESYRPFNKSFPRSGSLAMQISITPDIKENEFVIEYISEEDFFKSDLKLKLVNKSNPKSVTKVDLNKSVARVMGVIFTGYKGYTEIYKTSKGNSKMRVYFEKC